MFIPMVFTAMWIGFGVYFCCHFIYQIIKYSSPSISTAYEFVQCIYIVWMKWMYKRKISNIGILRHFFSRKKKQREPTNKKYTKISEKKERKFSNKNIIKCVVEFWNVETILWFVINLLINFYITKYEAPALI